MSPPQQQFIDLATRAPNVDAHAQALPPFKLAARVPAATRDLYSSTARMLKLHALPRPVAIDAESARWRGYLTSLREQVTTGAVSELQRATLLAILGRAQSRSPSVRRPAVGISSEGALQASWAFEDLPARAFTLEILRDGTIEWFYGDGTSGLTCGTGDEPEHDLPDDALELLVGAFSR